MAQETEIKLKIQHARAFRRILKKLGGGADGLLLLAFTSAIKHIPLKDQEA